MALDIDALRASFELVASREPHFVRRFYEILFERHPASRALFGNNSADKQQRMLTEALVAVMDHLEDASWLSSQLGALGAKHVAYGVTEEMYDWVGASLLATLAEVAQEAWTPSLEKSWSAAYAAIRGLMLAGARAPAISA